MRGVSKPLKWPVAHAGFLMLTFSISSGRKFENGTWSDAMGAYLQILASANGLLLGARTTDHSNDATPCCTTLFQGA